MIRKWIATQLSLPNNNQKIYYFCDFLGIFKGNYYFDEKSKSDPHKFCSHHGILDRTEVSYWMPYDHALRDIIPLPPDYTKVDINNSQSIINTGEEISIPEEEREFSFTFIQTKGE